MRINTTPSNSFQGKRPPDDSRLVGWSALVETFAIRAPVRRPSAVSERHVAGSQQTRGQWRIFDRRYWPGKGFAEHLTFAFRHEQLDLLILKRLFDAVPQSEVEALVRAAPTGATPRRAWFLYEWLTGRTLDLPDAPRIAAIELLDPKEWFTGRPTLSRRHRVRANQLGTQRFCPLIRRTPRLMRLTERDLGAVARDTMDQAGTHLVSRAASFLLLADSRASFEIEGERPPRSRIERWGRAVVDAGRRPLTLDEIVQLHEVLIEDDRFVQVGLRPDGVFLGDRDPLGEPIPEFIGARPADLPALMGGLLDANRRMAEVNLDPVLQAAATAFAFVYVHPLQDGNGRLHRCLVHHILAERGFSPPGIVFPVSAVMLDRIDEYKRTLRAHSGPLMPFIEWRPTPSGNVEVREDTADLYRYYDCTEGAEFLYDCVEQTVSMDLPRELEHLRRHDEAKRRIMETVEMPDRLADDLIMFIRQNGGRLANRRRNDEFKQLDDEEVTWMEAIVVRAFEGFEASKPIADEAGK